MNEIEVLFRCYFECLGNMEVPCFAKNCNDLRFRIEQGAHYRIIFRSVFWSMRTAKRNNLRIAQPEVFCLLEIVQILRIRTRPAPLYKLHAEFIKLLGNPELILNRK